MGPKVDKKAAAKPAAQPAKKAVAAPKRLNEPKTVEKKIGGEKNGGTRKVTLPRQCRYYPTQEDPRKIKGRKKPFKDHKRKIRSSITPGTILILVAGPHKGKRVVFLKQLASGLLLVTGPYFVNGCPLRRINQIYVIATKTKLNIDSVTLPDRLTDDYFRRQKLNKAKMGEGDIFESKKEVYSVSEERKEDQSSVDKQLLAAIRKSGEKKLILGYLGAMFSLSKKQFPHKMIF
ncbi:hypothetical protein CAPTEDRAFT_152321 [Capitella teleta]|uniref:Large ribosomal subunit protein eL6 n=1 Tax=Capitella teleta TaxID=283909 RepID=R7UMQ0_CAPTE|nr:hypothetical protein CAPTEDRAFT_152321 [Capitella teleta]|eukprot:ELU07814.1 hypothetical protein CAPTEDRAFT_152321 [Capitella teleta]